jgi:hypothetical protein
MSRGFRQAAGLGCIGESGFHSATVVEVVVTELSPLLVEGRVRWALNDASGALLYEFATTYILGRFDALEDRESRSVRTKSLVTERLSRLGIA